MEPLIGVYLAGCFVAAFYAVLVFATHDIPAAGREARRALGLALAGIAFWPLVIFAVFVFGMFKVVLWLKG